MQQNVPVCYCIKCSDSPRPKTYSKKSCHYWLLHHSLHLFSICKNTSFSSSEVLIIWFFQIPQAYSCNNTASLLDRQQRVTVILHNLSNILLMFPLFSLYFPFLIGNSISNYIHWLDPKQTVRRLGQSSLFFRIRHTTMVTQQSIFCFILECFKDHFSQQNECLVLLTARRKSCTACSFLLHRRKRRREPQERA